MDNITEARRAPWHLRIATIFCAAWAIFLVYGFVMTVLRDPAFLARFPVGMIEMLDRLPSWARAARACGIWAAPVAAILLFFRSRHAFIAFLVILAALALGTTGEQIVGLPDAMRSGPMIGVKLANWMIVIVFLVYCHRLIVARHLR